MPPLHPLAARRAIMWHPPGPAPTPQWHAPPSCTAQPCPPTHRCCRWPPHLDLCHFGVFEHGIHAPSLQHCDGPMCWVGHLQQCSLLQLPQLLLLFCTAISTWHLLHPLRAMPAKCLVQHPIAGLLPPTKVLPHVKHVVDEEQLWCCAMLERLHPSAQGFRGCLQYWHLPRMHLHAAARGATHGMSNGWCVLVAPWSTPEQLVNINMGVTHHKHGQYDFFTDFLLDQQHAKCKHHS